MTTSKPFVGWCTVFTFPAPTETELPEVGRGSELGGRGGSGGREYDGGGDRWQQSGGPRSSKRFYFPV